MKIKTKFDNFLTLLGLITGLLFTTSEGFGQKPIGLVDSLENSVKDIKEEITKIKEDYYIIVPYGLAGNVGVYVSQDYVILVDDQWAVLSTRIKELVKSVTDKPIRYIINSHFHYDHADGNRSFGKEKIPIVSHVNARNRLSKDQQLTLSGLQKAHAADVLPTITYSDAMNLEEPNETIELIHMKNAHTDGDTFIYFKKANIYHTGDVFVRYGIPFIDENNGGDVYGMIAAANYLMEHSNSETKFIPGHGIVCSVQEVRAFRDLLVLIRDHVIRLYKEGASIEKVLTEVKIDQKIGGVNKQDFVRHTYRMVQKHEKF
jgi:glyoxylase-like metal-dependent hydrolase (beta-lactamase superfamily II)